MFGVSWARLEGAKYLAKSTTFTTEKRPTETEEFSFALVELESSRRRPLMGLRFPTSLRPPRQIKSSLVGLMETEGVGE